MKVILTCSRGHRHDTSEPFSRHLKPGMGCPVLMEYDRIDGRKYCRRALKVAREAINKALGK